MKLALKLAWEYRTSWIAMFLLTAASALTLIVCLHVSWATGIVATETDDSSLQIDLYISVIAVLLITQTIATLCLESQARDLAIIKTCGASPRAIQKTVLGEITIVTIAGFLLGAVISLPVVGPYVTWSIGISTDIVGREFGFNIPTYIVAFVALLITVWIGSIIIIRRVSRQNVVDALANRDPFVKKPKRFVAMIFAGIALLMNVAIVIAIICAKSIVTFVEESIRQSGDSSGDGLNQVISSVQGGLIMMLPMLFTLGCMVIFTVFAPKLYPFIVRIVARCLPKTSPGWLEVGVKLAAHNAKKYYGSITPMVIFVLVIVMIFAVINSATEPIYTLYEQHGVQLDRTTGTNYDAVIMLIGPALFIAFVGSIANMIMSGRNRMYVHKLTSIIGMPSRAVYKQAFAEIMSYTVVAAVLGVVTLLCVSVLVWVAGNMITGVMHPISFAWVPFLLSLVAVGFIISIPAVAAAYRSQRLASRNVLESFGE